MSMFLHLHHQMPMTIKVGGAPIVMSLDIQEDEAPHDRQTATYVVVEDEHLLGHLTAILEVGGAFPGHLTDILGDTHFQDHLIAIQEDVRYQGHLIGILEDTLHLDHLTTTTTTDGLRPGHQVVSLDDEPLLGHLITT